MVPARRGELGASISMAITATKKDSKRWWSSNGDFFPKKQQRVIKWDPFWCDQIMQVYGDFEGFDLQHALFFGW